MKLSETNKCYTLVYESPYKGITLLSKRLLWDYESTARFNLKEYKERKFLATSCHGIKGALVYPKLKILEIDCENPDRSRYL